jgi:hypothetical protein
VDEIWGRQLWSKLQQLTYPGDSHGIAVENPSATGRTDQPVPICSVKRPVNGATPVDFRLSLAEARQLPATLQQLVTHDQINAYDKLRRNCRECGRYRRIRDWRPRCFSTALGRVQVKVPRVVSCLCTPEPYNDNGDSISLPLGY